MATPASAISLQRDARVAMVRAVMIETAADRSDAGINAAAQGSFLTVGLAALQRWSRQRFTPEPPAFLPGRPFNEAFRLVLEGHRARLSQVIAMRPVTTDPVLLTALAGIAATATVADVLLDALPGIDGKSIDGYAGSVARWIEGLTLTTPPIPMAASFAVTAALTEIRRQRERLAEIRKRVLKWRFTRDAKSRLTDDGSEHFQVLVNADYRRYSQIADREDFYHWVYRWLVDHGHQTRWPLAAWIVAANARLISIIDDLPLDVGSLGQAVLVSNDLQAAMRTANQVIFDDVLPKLLKLTLEGVLEGPLTGQAAVDWDVQTLAEEQNLVQRLDEALDSSDQEDLWSVASQSFLTRVGQLIYDLPPIKEEAGIRYFKGVGVLQSEPGYCKSGPVPKFPGTKAELFTPMGRWTYGLLLARTFAAFSVDGKPGSMPPVAAGYRDGSILASLNLRPHLHKLDSMLGDRTLSLAEVRELGVQLTAPEKAELKADAGRLERLGQRIGQLGLQQFLESL